MTKKQLILLLFLFLKPLFIAAQGPIYITLDVSPSMTGTRYNLANYSAQTLAVLNQNRNIVFVVNSETYEINNDYKQIQKRMNEFGGFKYSEIWDIDKLNAIVKPKTLNQDVFIIGDGYWAEDKLTYDNFTKIVNSGNVKAVFLETISSKLEVSSFENYFHGSDIGKIYKVTSTEEIINAINQITEEITGVSAIPTNRLLAVDDCVSFTTEMTVNNMKLMVQASSKLSDLPKIASISVNGKMLNFNELGSPTNEGFAHRMMGLMSSGIYEVTSKIPSGSKIEICFDKAIDPNLLKIYPIVEAEIGNFNLAIQNGQITQIDDNTYGICKENNTTEIFFEINQKENQIPEELLKKTDVKVISDHKTYHAVYSDGVFSVSIPTVKNTTTYTIESELKGYFRKVSGQKKIVKTDNCKPPPPPKLEPLPMQYLHFGEISLDNLLREGRISSRIVDEQTGEPISPEYFDIKLSNNYKAIFKNIRMEFREDNWIDLIIEPRGQWCDCFIPDQLKIDFYADPKEGMTIDGKYYRPIQAILTVDIIKEKSWMERCAWLLFSMIGSLLLSWYLILISRKKRFRNGSRIVFKYPNISSRKTLNPTYITSDFNLRKSGFIAWLNRWFNPFVTEKNTIGFHNIDLTLQFIAAKSMRYVYFPKASFNESTMESVNYDPDSKDRYIQLDENNELKVTHQRLAVGKTTNFLSYAFPRKAGNDISAFRFVLGIFILLLLAYFFIALILIIKSLF